MSAAPILIAFDGSDAAREAVGAAGRLFAGRDAAVVTAWRSLEHAAGLARAGLPEAVADQAIANLDEVARKEAEQLAAEGVSLAQAAGLHAEPVVVEAGRAVAAALLERAEALGADAIVVGARGMSGVRSVLLGSVSNAIVHGAGRPVLVVHAPR